MSLITGFDINITQTSRAMFCCCEPEQPGYQYEVNTIVQNGDANEETIKYVKSLEQVDHDTRNSESTRIIKLKKQVGLSSFRQKNAGKLFTDPTFPPNSSSLGEENDKISWRRVPQILGNMSPVLFDRKIQPTDVISGHAGDCYILSALAALAQFPDIVKAIFRGEKVNPEGCYKISLRVDGVVQETIIDDYIPVHDNGLPIFCQPNKKTGQIWVVLLEKALAKVHGSYANLNEGIPSQIFRAVTYAPSESLVFSRQNEQRQKIWSIIKQYSHNHYPLCATTKEDLPISLGIDKAHTYTIISAEDLHGVHGSSKIIKLRNPWGNVDYHSRGSANDHQFWSNIQESPEKEAIRTINNNCDLGLFYMLFDEFYQYFHQIHYCDLNKGGKFVSQQLTLAKSASFFDVNIQREDIFTFGLDQSKINGQSLEQRHDEGICRSTIVLLRKVKTEFGVNMQFINGIMKYNETNTILTEKLSPGSYVVYAKIDPTVITHKLPQKATLNIYSRSSLPELIAVPRTKYPAMIRSALLNHAVNNKRNQFQDNKIWVSWQLFYQKGGFAYLAAGNHRESNHTVVINFNEDEFSNLSFKLKKPFKGKGNGQVLRISPGTQEIIIVRVINNPKVKTVKFPPKLDIKLEPLYR